MRVQRSAETSYRLKSPLPSLGKSGPPATDVSAGLAEPLSPCEAGVAALAGPSHKLHRVKAVASCFAILLRQGYVGLEASQDMSYRTPYAGPSWREKAFLLLDYLILQDDLWKKRRGLSFYREGSI